MKVMFLTSSYPRNQSDGTANFLRHLAQELHRKQIQMTVIAPADNAHGITEEEGITVHRFCYLPRSWQGLAYGSGILQNLRARPWLWLQVPFFLLSMTYTMVQVIRRDRPDVIHAHWILPQGAIALLAKWLFHIPVVTTLHGSDAHALRGTLLDKLKRFIVSHSSTWTTNTRNTSLPIAAGSSSAGPPHIIPMGIHISSFQTVPGGHSPVLKQDNSHQVALFVGRLIEFKGVCYLIDAFKRMPQTSRETTELWIVGDGILRTQLEKQARESGSSERIRFFGNIAHARLPDFFAAADFFVGPSITTSQGDEEGQGVVFLEAFASGVCVLATASGGIPEVVEDGVTGILVPPKDAEKLAAAMLTLLTDKTLRDTLAERAFRKVNEIYAWEKIADRFESVYKSVLTQVAEK